jgi:hypothetical protein
MSRLVALHRGVYAVGHQDLSDRGRCVAALLAVGTGATLSHRTALALWKLTASMPQSIEVTLTDRVPRHRAGIRVHSATTLNATVKDGLPVTTALRSLQDAGTPRAWSEALYRGLIDRAQTEAEPTQSELEDALLPALAQAGIPKPLTQRPIGPYRVDFLWPTTSSSSRPTAGRPTATAPPSRRTARATPGCRQAATRCSASPGAR